MSGGTSEIALCPPERRGEAVAIVLSEIAPSQRREIAGRLLEGGGDTVSGEALYVARRGERLVGAAWGQLQPGNTAVFWPPHVVAGEGVETTGPLAAAVVRHLDRAGVGMTQVLLPAQDAEIVPVLASAGFSHLADLLYLACESEAFPAQPVVQKELSFRVYYPAERPRLMEVVERTYEDTLDCAGLNNMRRMEDVIDGYAATGVFRAENWWFACRGDQDVGVLLLAEHPRAGHWELMYMGLVPEARGHGWGLQIIRHGQWLAWRAGAERIVLAVDTKNRPALAMYERAGFAPWDQRSVFVRVFR